MDITEEQRKEIERVAKEYIWYVNQRRTDMIYELSQRLNIDEKTVEYVFDDVQWS